MKLTFPISEHTRKQEVIICLLVAVLLGKITLFSNYAGILFLFSLFLLMFLNRPLKALSLLIIALPYSGTNLFLTSFVNIPGAKPLNLLFALVIIISIIYYKKTNSMPPYILAFIILFITIFIISVFRSISYLDIINTYTEEILSVQKYILSTLVRPLLYFIPFIIIIKFVKTKDDVLLMTNTIVFSLIILSCFLLYIYLFKAPDKDNIRAVGEYYSFILNIHRNDLATFYIVGFPIIISRFFHKKDIVGLAAIYLSIITVCFLYSRTAYVILPVSLISYLIISKRNKYIPFVIFIFVGLVFVVSPTILDRASKGLESGDRDEISAGRIDDIWLPVINEYGHNSKKLLFGNGRYAIVSTDAVAYGMASETTKHPHNMYLEQILDAGIVWFIILMIFLAVIFYKILKMLHYFKDIGIKEYHYGLIVSLISYFIAGITGRTLFPKLISSYFWIILGISIAITIMAQEQKEQRSDTIVGNEWI